MSDTPGSALRHAVSAHCSLVASLVMLLAIGAVRWAWQTMQRAKDVLRVEPGRPSADLGIGAWPPARRISTRRATPVRTRPNPWVQGRAKLTGPQDLEANKSRRCTTSRAESKLTTGR
jgi:hypothetical protein